MDDRQVDDLAAILLELVPADGSGIGNRKLAGLFREKVAGQGLDVTPEQFETLRAELIARGLLVKGRGRGGSVRRAEGDAQGFGLASQAPAAPKKKVARKKAAKKKAGQKGGDEVEITAYRHSDKRVNNPPVGMVTPETDRVEEPKRWAYDPHIAPELRFDVTRSQVEKIIDEALASNDEEAMREALATLKRMSGPFLDWTGKAERTSFEVETVSLHVHERIDPATILANVRKRLKDQKPGEEWRQPDLFSPPFENLPLREAIEFYRHEKGWANRLIAGDSLLVMNSLLQKEGMAGQVQMIYIDPPYGIKYGSNFQPFVNKRDVKDRKDEDLTQEPEMIKAFRDTWELGIHSYLTYLRDRLLLARELLAQTGSIFVQISDENVHHVRELMDEVYGAGNFLGLIPFTKSSSTNSPSGKTLVLSSTVDYLVWYAKDAGSAKFHHLYKGKAEGVSTDQAYSRGDLDHAYTVSDLTAQKPTTVFDFEFLGIVYNPFPRGWRTVHEGMTRAAKANRIEEVGKRIRYRQFLADYPVIPLTNHWQDTGIAGFSSDKRYVVETSAKVIERCLLMTTDPGDLVLDPTCGSGTTAFVAEKWGRRWITCDTSRVAVTLAKQRLMTASYDYYTLRYPHEGLKGGFIYKTVPHVTLKSIANNPEIDEIYERMHPAIEAALADLNAALRKDPPAPFKVAEGGRKGQVVDFTRPKSETVTLPSGEEGPAGALLEWEVPFEFPDGWPESARAAFDRFHAARQEMQKAMDESIAAHADQEILYDQPEVDRKRLRVTGPFTVEAVPFPSVLALEEAEKPKEADVAVARAGESARIHQWRDELLKTGIRGKGGQVMQFAELELLPGTRYLHATGTLEFSVSSSEFSASGSEGSKLKIRNSKPETENSKLESHRVVVSFGPEFAPLEQRQVEFALREAEKLRPPPKFVIFAAFEFDPEAAKDIDELEWPGVTLLKAQMNTDLLTEDLKKKRANNQSFWLMGQPDIELVSGKFLVSSNTGRLCPHGWFKELSGLDRLEQIHGLGREDLFLYALLAQGRAVWDYLANAQGWDLHTGQYRRGAGKKPSSGIPPVSWRGARIAGGTGDLDSALRAAGLPGLDGFRNIVDGLRRDPETPRRLAQIAANLNFPFTQLETKNLQLKTYFEVEVHGFDYFDTRTGELVSGGKGKIAVWALDTDYDERSLYPDQVFFPMAGRKDGWYKLKKNLRAELNEDLLERYHGTVSLPFEPGENRRVAVKIVDDRGIESLRIITLD